MRASAQRLPRTSFALSQQHRLIFETHKPAITEDFVWLKCPQRVGGESTLDGLENGAKALPPVLPSPPRHTNSRDGKIFVPGSVVCDGFMQHLRHLRRFSIILEPTLVAEEIACHDLGKGWKTTPACC